jgi:hypothetical protein
MAENIQEKKSVWFRLLRILLRISAVLAALLIVLVLVLNIPAVQTFIAGKFIKNLREETGAAVSLGSLKIAIPNTVNIEDLFLSDKNADTLLYLHSLSVDVSLFRLLRNEVAVKSIELENVSAKIGRKTTDSTFNFQFLIDLFKPAPDIKPDTPGKPRKPWLIKVSDVHLKNIRATFFDMHGGTDLRVILGEFNATLKDIDLSKRKININEILLKNTSVSITLTPKATIEEAQEAAAKTLDTLGTNDMTMAISGVFISLNISADQLTIENTNFRFDNNASQRLTEGIDYAHMDFSNLNASVRNINIDAEGYRAIFENMSVAESCGLEVKKLSADAEFTDSHAQLKNLKLETSASKISGEMSLGYASFNGFLADLWNSETMVDLYNSTVNANEALIFVPFLAYDSYISNFKNSDIFISAKAGGKLNDLDIENLELTMLNKTILKSRCRLTGIPDINSMVFDATVDRFSTNLTDIYRFVDPSVFAGLKLPPSFELKGSAGGKISSVKGEVELKSAFGNILADGFYQSYDQARRDTFCMAFTVQNLLAGTILTDTSLGKVSFSGNASGSGISSSDISGSVNLDIHDALYNAYTFKDIVVDGRMTGKIISVTASSDDANLNFKLIADADLSDAKHQYSAQLDLKNANLHVLNFSEKELSLSTNLTAEANYAGYRDADAHLVLTNTSLSSAGKTVPLKNLEIRSGSTPDSIRAELTSDFLDGIVYGNIPADNLVKTLQSSYNRYFGLADTIRPESGKHLAFNMNVHFPEEILQLFSLESGPLNISHIKGDYSTDNNETSFELRLPFALVAGVKVDSLNLAVKGENENLIMSISLRKLSYDTLNIENIRIKEEIDKGVILSEISLLDTLGKQAYLFANRIETGDDFYRLSFLPEGLILNGSTWKVGEGNWFDKRNGKFEAEQFVFSNGGQSFGFETDQENQKIVFDNFGIQNITNILTFQGERRLFNGNLNGEVVFPVGGAQKFINADLVINDMYFQDSLVGDIIVRVNSINDRMDIESRLESDQNKLSVTGVVDRLSGTPELDLTAFIDVNNLSRLERFSLGTLTDMGGKVDGEISLKGTMANPEINGFIGFEETVFKISTLNFLARIREEKIQIDPAGIHFTDFVIEDAEEKKLTINGDLLLTDFSNPGFDLQLITNDFQPVNSSVSDNPLLYGKLNLNADAKLRGNMKNPVLKADVKINSSTNLTYALPGSELQLVTSEGVVVFLDPSRINDSITTLKGDYLTDSIISRLTGLDLALNLEIDPAARFTVDIDPKSGDFLAVSGGAKLYIAADPGGKQAITGVYEVNNGVYQLSFYGLVKKTFTIAPGSTISWSGKPMDADLDITAEYEVRTSSVSLVANETAEMSDAEKQTFNKRLPYMVKLNINGFMAEPEISFNIDLPEKYMLTYPLVATKLALLNSEENKSDLNKQVFALLVTGSFMADNPLSSNSSSPTNIASTAARNSVNGILADQLNNVSGKFITGVDVNFGLTSYEDFEDGSGDIRTEMDIQVSKKLFNDRITVEAMGSFDLEGDKSNSATSSTKKMTNEFAVIYQLTESGEYKLRAYYEDAYDLFDGDISYSGIAIIFEREYDTLKRKKKVPFDSAQGDKE